MRKVAVVTSTRADFGLLQQLLQRLQAAPDIQVQLIVTGMHLLAEFGDTWREVEGEGVPVAASVPLYDSADGSAGLTCRRLMARVVARGLQAFSTTLSHLGSDLLVVPGDRFEMLAAVQAALFLDIPVAHIHGGEITEGAVDDAIRHAITKMASLHFVASRRYRYRVIQLGEEPQRVFNVGAPALERLLQHEPVDRRQFETELGFVLPSPSLLVTYHPETYSPLDSQQQIDELLQCLQELPDVFCLFTAPNVDAGGECILQSILRFQEQFPQRCGYIPSLGHRRYLQALQLVNAVVGNSSSGIIEVPSFGIPTVNIGDRQMGRERAASVIDVACRSDAIGSAIRQALAQPRLSNPDNPYHSADSSQLMVEQLRRFDIAGGCRKRFFDLPLQQLHKAGASHE